MKNTKNFAILFILSLAVFSLGILPVSAETGVVYVQNNTQDIAIIKNQTIYQQFLELQRKIDSTLVISNGKYIYNPELIKSIVVSENFDFNQFNNLVGTNYNEDSFISSVLNQIENTNPTSARSLRSIYCNRNASSSGWNYNRTWADNTNSGLIAYKLYQAAANWGLVGTSSVITTFIPVIGPSIAVGMALGSGFNGWYSNSLANAITVNMTGCGTVIDINKFTSVFSVWDQRKF